MGPKPKSPTGVKSKTPKDAQPPKCDPKTFADTKKAEQLARKQLSAQVSPKSAHDALATKANELASKLKKMSKNPACKKLLKKSSPQKKEAAKAKANQQAAQDKKNVAQEEKTQKAEKRTKAIKEGRAKKGSELKSKEQLRAFKEGGQERLNKEMKAKYDKNKQLAIAQTVARKKEVFKASMAHLKKLHQDHIKELSKKTQERLATMKADFALHAEKVMETAKERGKKYFLPKAARRESRFKAKAREKRQEKYNKKHTERFTKRTLRMSKMKEKTAKSLAKDLEKGATVYTEDFVKGMSDMGQHVSAADANKLLLKLGFTIGSRSALPKTADQKLSKAKAEVAEYHHQHDKNYNKNAATKKKLADQTAHAARKAEQKAKIAVPGAKNVAAATKNHNADLKKQTKQQGAKAKTAAKRL